MRAQQCILYSTMIFYVQLFALRSASPAGSSSMAVDLLNKGIQEFSRWQFSSAKQLLEKAIDEFEKIEEGKSDDACAARYYKIESQWIISQSQRGRVRFDSIRRTGSDLNFMLENCGRY